MRTLHYPACQRPVIRNRVSSVFHARQFLRVAANRNGGHNSETRWSIFQEIQRSRKFIARALALPQMEAFRQLDYSRVNETV